MKKHSFKMAIDGKVSIFCMTFLSILVCTRAGAQQKEPFKADTSTVAPSKVDPVTKAKQLENIQKLMNKTFSTIATGQGDGANMKTYGSFEPLNGSYKFNVFGSAGSEEEPVLFSLTLKGSINSDNIGVLFDNSEFSSGTTISAKIHFPVKGARITVMVADEDRIKREIARLIRLAGAKTSMLNSGLDAVFIANQLRLEKEQLVQLKKDKTKDSLAIIKLQPSIDNGKSGDKAYSGNLEASLTLGRHFRSLDTLIAYSKFRIDSLDFLSLPRHSWGLQDFEEKKIGDALKAKTDSLWLTLPVKSQDFTWFSLVGSYGRNKYYSFTEGGHLSDQFKERRNEPFNVGVEFSRFWTTGEYYDYGSGDHKSAKPIRIQSLNFGLVWMGGSDIDSYTTTELSSSRKFAVGDTTNTLGKKYNVYTDAVDSYKAVKLYGSYYYFFGKGNSYAVHPFGEVEFRNSDRNPFGLGVGLVFSLKNKKDNSIFNMELYGKLKDMGRALVHTEYGMLRRNEVGLNFAVPLNLPKKK